jgi:hypothetical protein
MDPVDVGKGWAVDVATTVIPGGIVAVGKSVLVVGSQVTVIAGVIAVSTGSGVAVPSAIWVGTTTTTARVGSGRRLDSTVGTDRPRRITPVTTAAVAKMTNHQGRLPGILGFLRRGEIVPCMS